MTAHDIHVTTPAGTDFHITELGIPISSDGDYRTPGTGGNLPAGEVFVPVENCNGVLVIDGSVRTEKDTYLSTKAVLVVENGVVVHVEGEREAMALLKSLHDAKARSEYPERVSRVCEFGIGLNHNAVITGTTILDEKALGTAHIAIGSNYWFGGKNKTIIHYDQVFRDPTIIVDGEKIEW